MTENRLFRHASPTESRRERGSSRRRLSIRQQANDGFRRELTSGSGKKGSIWSDAAELVVVNRQACFTKRDLIAAIGDFQRGS